jgi:hypothetical protein
MQISSGKAEIESALNDKTIYFRMMGKMRKVEVARTRCLGVPAGWMPEPW